jgi:SAM-dependent methyltransferase
MHPYNADYFERGVELGLSGYTDYRWLPEATIPLAHDLIQALGIREGDRVLDYGCAKGYLVHALRLLHIDAWGFDISEYALSEAHPDVRSYVRSVFIDARGFDWIIAKDVLEHVTYQGIRPLLSQFRRCTNGLFVAVPLAENGKYCIEAYERDVTHVIREGLDWWVAEIEKAGFRVRSASYVMDHVKANWAHFERGNGFVVAR